MQLWSKVANITSAFEPHDCFIFARRYLFSDSHAISRISGRAASAEFRKICKFRSRRLPFCHTLESMIQLHGTQPPLVGKKHGHCDKCCPKFVCFMFFMRISGCFYSLPSIKQQHFINFIGINKAVCGLPLRDKNSQQLRNTNPS